MSSKRRRLQRREPPTTESRTTKRPKRDNEVSKSDEKFVGFPTDLKVRVIYADCPWDYGYGGDASHVNREGVTPYRTMATADLKLLPVEKLAKDDMCFLFLWATVPKLQDAFEVGNAWGFSYVQCLTWVKQCKGEARKPKGGVGFYLRGCTEMLLIFKRQSRKGRVTPFLDRYLRTHCMNVIEATPTAHSEKPECVRKFIERYVVEPDGQIERIELFARPENQRPIAGWHLWGDHIDCHFLRDPVIRDSTANCIADPES